MLRAHTPNIMLTGPFLDRDDSKINLGLNENPYAIPERVQQRLGTVLARLHRYPLGHEQQVLALICRHYHVPPGSVAITRGVDEAQDRLLELFPGMRYVIFRPSFLGYEARLKLAGADHVTLPFSEDFGIRDEDWLRIGSGDFVILANPNNPTGTMLAPEDLRRLARAAGKILVDEAYIDYAGRESMLSHIDANVFVFRSLSKTFGLAGQRLGFLFGGAEVMASIRNRQWFCNTDVLSLELISSLLGEPFLAECAARIIADRGRLTGRLREFGFDVRESFTNFVLLRSPRARAIIDHLDERGIVVMDTSVYGLPGYVRITVGTPEQNEALLDTMRDFAERG